ncbi:hypothetical protein LSH36_108g02100 [Paralvinella palmiformis]|uniref:Uncharacterized protein n=1 Tax=Paralvinella palmiformis TaxID=53620 RepID=A0AAD9K0J7_9ANNE|nr:hypothetical protein LSH36_108g02100 [Paralvinella palmiformis]
MQDPVQWHIKNKELDVIKKKIKKVMGKFNIVQCNYSDWFKRQQKSFLFDVKSMQVIMPSLVAQEVHNVKDLRSIVRMGQAMQQAGRGIGTLERLDKFLGFWDEFCEVRKELDDLIFDLNRYVVSITSLREPEIKTDLDGMYDDLTYKCSETYMFGDLNNERDNLFTYALNVSDQQFMGLIGYLPYLLKLATKICFRVISKVHLEQE